MADMAQVLRIIEKLEQIRQIRPDVYDLFVKALDLPDDEQADALEQILPIIRHGMN